MTPKPQFLSFKRPIQSVAELAEAIESKFGGSCVLVGKAVSLIGMLAPEFVFVFHEGASGYVRHSRKLHGLLKSRIGGELKMHPILRVRYDTWDALKVCCSWLRLPEPLQRPFGTEELCAPSFADRWREVGDEQKLLLEKLGTLRRPTELIGYLDQALGGSWKKLAQEYKSLHSRLDRLQQQIAKIKEERDSFYDALRRLKLERVETERAKGAQFRAKIRDQVPSQEDLLERERLAGDLDRIESDRLEVDRKMRELRVREFELTSDEEVRRIHERRRSIELEAELKRARLIKGAVTASKGLSQASLRPGAWWFPLVCPDGLWFRETVNRASCYLEPLSE